jgi:hypothetical protein
LLSIQELELHAHSNEGKELEPTEPAGEGIYPWGCKPEVLFDHDPNSFPLIDKGALDGDGLGSVSWSFDEPACIEDFRLQTAKAGWWNCESNCADPKRWVLEADGPANLGEWSPVMTQDTDYAMPLKRAAFT